MDKNSKPFKVTLPVGTKGWFQTKFQHADVFEIVQETEVLAVDHSHSWIRTLGHVPGFPNGHPALLVFKPDLENATKTFVQVATDEVSA